MTPRNIVRRRNAIVEANAIIDRRTRLLIAAYYQLERLSIDEELQRAIKHEFTSNRRPRLNWRNKHILAEVNKANGKAL